MRYLATHYIIPDLQILPGKSMRFVEAIAAHIKSVKPTHVIHLGDHWDMLSLCSYDKGKRSAENRRYWKDIKAGNAAMDILNSVIKCERHFCLGNHEQRIERYVEDHPELEGTVGYDNFNLSGWTVHDFLQPVTVSGVTYCHYFPRTTVGGRVMQNKRGAPNARIQLQREMRSVTSGHMQGFSYHEHYVENRRIQSMIVGSAYPYKLNYLTPQGQNHFRGTVVKQFYKKGEYDHSVFSLERLMK